VCVSFVCEGLSVCDLCVYVTAVPVFLKGCVWRCLCVWQLCLYVWRGVCDRCVHVDMCVCVTVFVCVTAVSVCLKGCVWQVIIHCSFDLYFSNNKQCWTSFRVPIVSIACFRNYYIPFWLIIDFLKLIVCSFMHNVRILQQCISIYSCIFYTILHMITFTCIISYILQFYSFIWNSHFL